MKPSKLVLLFETHSQTLTLPMIALPHAWRCPGPPRTTGSLGTPRRTGWTSGRGHTASQATPAPVPWHNGSRLTYDKTWLNKYFLVISKSVFGLVLPNEVVCKPLKRTSPVLLSSGNGLHGMLNNLETESRVLRLASYRAYRCWNSPRRCTASAGVIPGTAGPWASNAFRNWITSTKNVCKQSGSHVRVGS